MEQRRRDNKIVCSYVYKDHIKRVYDCYRLPEIFHKVLKHANVIELTNGENYSQVGTELKLGWKNVFCVYFKITEVIDTPNYKKIKFYTTKVEPYNILYTLNFHFYWNSIENSTLYMHEMIFDDPESMKNINVHHDIKEKLEMFQEIEKLLAERTEDLVQFESILIKCPINNVWDAITDWEILKDIVPSVAGKVKYKGEKYEIGTKIYVKDPIKKTAFDLKVIKCEMKDDCKKIFFLECFNGKPRTPLQELQFEFVRIDSDATFVSFTHQFKEPIKYELINSISKNKILILTEVKKRLEGDEGK